MSTWFTEQVKDGTIKTGVEFIKAYSGIYKQTDYTNSDGTLVNNYAPKYQKVDQGYFEKYKNALEELQKYESTSDEDIIKNIDKWREESISSTKSQIQDLIEKNKKYSKVIEEIERWKSPNIMGDKIKLSALAELKEECQSNKEMIDRLQEALEDISNPTNTYYTDKIFEELKFLKEKTARMFDQWQEHFIDVKKHNLYIQQLDESLKEKIDGMD